MKKTVLIILCLLALFGGCGKKEQNVMEQCGGMTVTFINGISDADVWILPETEENLKTTLWGAATVSKTEAGGKYETPLPEAGDDGLYIFRMIDTEGFYYSANGIELENGWTLRIKDVDLNAAELTVTDAAGVLKNTYEVFAARL